MYPIKKLFDTASQSAEAVNRQLIYITQRNLNLGLDLARKLAGARDPAEIVTVQASFWWQQFNECAAHAEDVRKRLFGLVFENGTPAPTPDSGPHERTRKSHTLPHQERCPAGPATARLKQKSGRQKAEARPPTAHIPKTAQSEVGRPKPRAQRSTAEKKSTRPGSTFRDPARKQSQEKPRATKTPTRQVTQAGALQRSSEEQKKSAHHEPAPQVLPMGVNFGMLDGNAVRFTNREAWWLVDGAWRPISPDEVFSNAAVMREARFKQLFPRVPVLPRKAFHSDNR
jgi:Phasin protein